jgi:hypothetical protein
MRWISVLWAQNVEPHPDKTKAAARCAKCENILPVRISADGTVVPIGMPACCEGAEFEVLEA